MTTTIQTVEPVVFTAGNTVKWKKYLADYLPGTWTLTYTFVQDGDQQTKDATDNGDGYHLLTLSAADTANFKDGIYYYQGRVSDGTDKYEVITGRVEIKPDFASKGNGFDARSHVKKVLDALEATVLGKASNDQLSYSINGRTIQRMAPEEIIKWQDHYQKLYRQELKKERIDNGQAPGNKVMVRF